MKFLTPFIFLLSLSVTAQDVLSDTDFEAAQQKYDDKEYKAALKYFDFEGNYTPEQYILFANCYDQMRDFKNENKTLATGLAKYKTSSELYNARAYFFERMREYDYSIRDASLAIKFAETDSAKYDYMSERAWTKFLMNDLEGAIADSEEVLAFDSLNVNVLNVLGIVYDESGQSDKAIWYLLKAYSLDSSDQNLVSNIGFLYQNAGEYEASIVYFNRSIELAPENGVAYNNRGYSRLMAGDVKGALEDVELGMELYPNNCYAYRNRALIYIEMGKMKKACNDMEIAIGLGFTTTYGDEVEKLQRRYCQ